MRVGREGGIVVRGWFGRFDGIVRVKSLSLNVRYCYCYFF